MGAEMREPAPSGEALARAELILELRSQGIEDQEVLKAMERVPREVFIPDKFLGLAYDNTALPIDLGQTISQPLIVAVMTEALELHSRVKVLEIGTGSGYQAMVLSYLTRRVYTIERHRPLMKQAEERFRHFGRSNITTRIGDGRVGWPEQAPFECIMVTAAAPDIPPVLVDQLDIGGRMVVPVGDGPHNQVLYKLVKLEDGTTQQTSLCNVRFVPLVEGIA
jgi:protein-L-isoaspartate(D-aspartate) O-methyltransferase